MVDLARLPIIPHESLGAPDCCGCLIVKLHGERAVISCNECGELIRVVAVKDLQKIFDELELALEVSSAACPHCGAVNLFAGFSTIEAFVCSGCGQGVALKKFVQ